MATGVNIKMGVTGVPDFKQKIAEAKASVKTLEDALKLCETQLRATGDKETYLKDKADLLKRKLEKQKEIVDRTKKALQEMSDAGVDKSSKAFQEMQQQCLRAEDELTRTKIELDNVKKGGKEAGDGVKGMNDKLKKIGNGVSFDNVTKGLKSITDNLKNAGRAAVNLGKKIISSTKDSSDYAKEIKLAAQQYEDMGITAEKYQQMMKVENFIDTPVDAILTARQRMTKALTTKSGKKSLEETLGLSLEGTNAEDLFWEIGDALMNMGEEFDKEEAAQKLFGRSWRELIPLFKAGREEYEKALSEQSVMTEEELDKLSEAGDAIKKVELEIQELKNKFWADNADKVTELMKWVVDNKDALVTAIGAIAGALGAIKIVEFATNITKVVDGFRTLKALGGGGGGTGTPTGGGGSPTVAPTGGGGSGLGWGGMLGVAGLTAIVSGFAKAGYMRNFQSEQVRGTDANLAAQSAGAEVLLAQYLNAEKARANFDWMSATEAEAAEIQAQVEATRQKLMEAEGGADALQAYSDWRQEHSYGNDYWELPDTLAQAVQDLTGGTDRQTQSNSEMAQAAKGLQGLPAAMANAVIGAMSGINVTIDGSVLAGWLNTSQATMVLNQ